MLQNKKILFIYPNFHNYGKAIQSEIEYLGAKVDSISYGESFFLSNLIKFFPFLSKIIENKKILEKYRRLNNKEYDYIFVIRGGLMSIKTYLLLKKQSPESKSILYLWDSIVENPSIKPLLPLFDSVISFDPSDCKVNEFEYLPLFYLKEFYQQPKKKQSEFEFDIAFVGRDHTDRFEIIQKVKKKAAEKNLKTQIFLVTSRFGYIKRKFLQFRKYKNASKSDFYFNNLSSKEIAEIYRKSKCVLDIEQSVQTGLTMRTFELLASGKKMITTNKSIEESNLFSEENILIIDRKMPNLEDNFFNTEFQQISSIKDYSLECWVKNIFSNSKDLN